MNESTHYPPFVPRFTAPTREAARHTTFSLFDVVILGAFVRAFSAPAISGVYKHAVLVERRCLRRIKRVRAFLRLASETQGT